MALDTTAFDPVFKDFYGPAMITMLNNKTRGLELFKKNTDTTAKADGRQYLYPIHLGRNPAVGAIGESKTLPSAQNQVTANVKIPYRYNYARIQLTAQTIRQSVSSKGAFKKALELETKGAVDDLARDRNRQLWGFGVGILCYVSGTNASGTTINVRSPGGVAYPGGVSTGAARFVLANQYIAFVRNATPTSATDSDIVAAVGTKQVSSVSADGTSIVLSATSGAQLNDGDIVVNASANVATESSVNKEVMGFLGLIDDGSYIGTLFNINRTTYPQYKSTVISVNGDLSLDVLQRAIDLQDEKGGDLKNTVLFSHHSVRREYLALLQTPKRYTGEMVMSPDAGFTNGGIAASVNSTDVTYATRPWIVERMCPLGMVFGIDKSYLTRYVVTEGEWADDDGTVLNRVLNQDSYEARFRVFDQFSSDRPDTCFRLDGIRSTFDMAPVE